MRAVMSCHTCRHSGAMQWLLTSKCLQYFVPVQDHPPPSGQLHHRQGTPQRHQAHLSLVFAFTIAARGQVTDVYWVAHSHSDAVS